MPRAEWDFIKNLKVPLPPPKEQHAIAAFLDTQCGRIDSIIAEMEQQIEILKQYKTSLITETVTKGLNKAARMKDSGINWIGKIPAVWGVKKIRYVTRPHNEKGNFLFSAKYIGLENIESSTGRYMQTETEYNEGFYDIVKKGDVLFGKLRPYLKKVYVSEIDGFCTGEFLIFTEFDGNKQYLYYFLLSHGFIETVNSSTYGAKMPRAEWDFIKNLKISFPSLNEQQAIAAFLDIQCTKTDNLITEKRQSIETMRAYKKSLIYEYVTGKKRVKGVMCNTDFIRAEGI
jgi:restriction endonuclease S subunit